MSTKDPNDEGNKIRVGARAGFANKYPGAITGQKVNRGARNAFGPGPEQKYQGIGRPHGPHTSKSPDSPRPDQNPYSISGTRSRAYNYYLPPDPPDSNIKSPIKPAGSGMHPSTEIHIHLGDAIKKRMGRRG